MHDPAGAYGLSSVARQFMAGVLRHLPAICAVTAPSTVSYFRLTPNRWAPTHAYIAERDREASLRVCPLLTLPGSDAARQFNVEFRAADAAASPHLALGARHLPHSLGEALDNLEATPEARDWFGPVFLDAYLRHKRAEIKMLDGLDESQQCARY